MNLVLDCAWWVMPMKAQGQSLNPSVRNKAVQHGQHASSAKRRPHGLQAQALTGPQNLNGQPAVRVDLQIRAGSLLPTAIYEQAAKYQNFQIYA